jgi:ribosomal protein S18 acetylase RimI-like enzyme
MRAATSPARPAAPICGPACSFTYDRITAGGTRIAARSAGKSIGAVEVTRLKNGDAEIRNLNVSSEYRGRGIGSDLVRNAVAHAGRSGATRVVLEARPSPNSIPAPGLMQMYTKLGFNVSGMSPRGNPTMHRMTGFRQHPGGR